MISHRSEKQPNPRTYKGEGEGGRGKGGGGVGVWWWAHFRKHTNINHNGLQRTANEYAEERRIYEDLISKNDK